MKKKQYMTPATAELHLISSNTILEESPGVDYNPADGGGEDDF